MSVRLGRVSLTILWLLLAPVVSAEPPLKVQLEVSFLLGYVEGSGCGFNRNGSWYDSSAAQKHLRDKYNYLSTKNQINSAEDFIEKAATRSMLSGKAYEVKCNGGELMPSAQWLLEELARFRTY